MNSTTFDFLANNACKQYPTDKCLKQHVARKQTMIRQTACEWTQRVLSCTTNGLFVVRVLFTIFFELVSVNCKTCEPWYCSKRKALCQLKHNDIITSKRGITPLLFCANLLPEYVVCKLNRGLLYTQNDWYNDRKNEASLPEAAVKEIYEPRVRFGLDKGHTTA